MKNFAENQVIFYAIIVLNFISLRQYKYELIIFVKR